MLDLVTCSIVGRLAFLGGGRFFNWLHGGVDLFSVVVIPAFHTALWRALLILSALFLGGDLDLLVLPLAVLADQFMQSFQVAEYVYPTTAVEVGGLKQPQVVAIEVALGHVVPGRRSSFEIESFELGNSFGAE